MNNKEQIEQKLTDMGLTFRYQSSVEISSIDIKKSLEDQARIVQKIDANVVSIYENDLKNGDIFPPIIIEDRFKNGTGMIVIDGNHRISSSRNNKETSWEFGAYILDPLTAMQFRVLTSEVNLKHGLSASIVDRIEHALYLVENGGVCQGAASEKMGISSHILSGAVLYKRVLKRVHKVGLNERTVSDKIKKAVLIKINTITDDDVFCSCIKYMIKSKLYSEELRSFLAVLKKIGTAREQLEYIKKENDLICKIKKITGGADSNVIKFGKKISFCLNNIKIISKINTESFPHEVTAGIIKKIDESILALSTIRNRVNKNETK